MILLYISIMGLVSSLKNGVSKVGSFLKNLGDGTAAVGAITTTAGYLFSALSPIVPTIGLPTLALGVTSSLSGRLLNRLSK